MGRERMACRSCGAYRYAKQLHWSVEEKDFVCRDKEQCQRAQQPFRKKYRDLRRALKV